MAKLHSRRKAAPLSPFGHKRLILLGADYPLQTIPWNLRRTTRGRRWNLQPRGFRVPECGPNSREGPFNPRFKAHVWHVRHVRMCVCVRMCVPRSTLPADRSNGPGGGPEARAEFEGRRRSQDLHWQFGAGLRGSGRCFPSASEWKTLSCPGAGRSRVFNRVRKTWGRTVIVHQTWVQRIGGSSAENDPTWRILQADRPWNCWWID